MTDIELHKSRDEKIDEMHEGRGLYEWTRHALRKIDRFGRDVMFASKF